MNDYLVCDDTHMSSKKRSLSRHLAWPLTPSDLDDYLGDLRVTVKEIRFLSKVSETGVVMFARWIPSDRRYGHGVHPDYAGIHVDVLPVGHAERSLVRAAMATQGLPHLRSWVAEVPNRAQTWLLFPQTRAWRHVASNIILDDFTG